MRIGIVGLPNVGKSTLFNALSRSQQALSANYPFSTVDANHASVPLPDERLGQLQRWVGVARAVPARVEFVDVAGLVPGAHKGEGLGNRFLGQLRDVQALVHVLRCFEDDNVVHVQGRIEPAHDIAIIQTELALADLQQVQRLLQKLERDVKGERKLQPKLELARRVEGLLGAGKPLRELPERALPAFAALQQEMRFLTAKPLIYVANVDEDALQAGNAQLQALRQLAAAEGALLLAVCAALEVELAELSEQERAPFLLAYGLEESSLEGLVRASYRSLHLMSCFTFNDEEVRAWTVRRGWTAPQAAGLVHSDMERGFIRAEVIPYDVFARYQSRAAVKAAGKLQLEGRDYVLRDGDLLYFRFHV